MNRSKEKKIIRSKCLAIREKVLPIAQEQIYIQVEKTINTLLKKEKEKIIIGIYWPLKGEVDLRSLKELPGISLALPASNKNGGLSYHKWSKNTLLKDACGIPAPLTEPPLKPNELKLLLVPALAVDKNGIRIGYGGGFFDRLRSNPNWRKIQALAIIPQACISNTPLPKDSWDIPFDGWINEIDTFQVNHTDY
ncbi:5-formyltetrahydrofolate cyclo-ligase [Prochlorococcus marinus]|uniref:5-formyltetrahydrofolate cyclo-ligase n=1 Tax=Prochlorococcus marinus TaxID=1219 RepID=UPI0022B5850B|nr:5-formyltetrahydrofolate cyclo-ligase [Prochlorococcus marinus]